MHRATNNTVNTLLPSRRLTIALLAIYMIVLCWILLFKFGVHFSHMHDRGVSLVPFEKLFTAGVNVDKFEIILNIIIFIPLGMYIGVLFKKWTWQRRILTITVISLSFEVLQFIFRIGVFDSTDIVTNTTGGVTGLLLFNALERLLKNETKSQMFINAIATVGTVIMIAFLLLLKFEMLPIRYQ